MLDLNSDKQKIILLIHPMLSSAEGMKEVIADNMGDEYRYVVPDLSAHGELSDEMYLSSRKESERIHNYLREKGINEIHLAFGASLGGVVLLQLLNYKDIKIKKAIFEGCSLWQNAKLTNFIVRNVFIRKHKKAVHNRALAVKKMTKLYGNKATVMADRFIEIDEQSIKNICYDCAFVKLPILSEEEQKKCLFLYGSKEFDLKSAKKALPKNYPSARLKLWNGYGHCTKMTSDTSEYCEFLKSETE